MDKRSRLSSLRRPPNSSHREPAFTDTALQLANVGWHATTDDDVSRKDGETPISHECLIMSRTLTPDSTLENLRKEAKRWLKALRAGDAGARSRLLAATPHAPADPGLRDVQLAVARGASTGARRSCAGAALARRTRRSDPAVCELAGRSDHRSAYPRTVAGDQHRQPLHGGIDGQPHGGRTAYVRHRSSRSTAPSRSRRTRVPSVGSKRSARSPTVLVSPHFRSTRPRSASSSFAAAGARRRAGTSARRGRWRATRWSVDFSIVVSTLVRTAARKRAGGRHRRGKRATRQCPRSIRKTNDYFAALDQEQYQRAHAMMAEINRNSLPLTQFIQQNHEFHQR
jgi:hypothetical protein